jgi:hypothetical protein
MKHVFWLTLIIFSWTSMTQAQDRYDEELIDTYDEESLTTGETFARLTFAGRDVALLHDNGERQEAVVNYPVASGDVIETGYQSYAELEFIDGSLMQFANRSKLEFQAINEKYDDSGLLTVVRLFEGTLMLHVTDQTDAFGNRLFRVDTEAGSAYIEAPGIYSVEQRGTRMRVKVFRGIAELAGERGSRLINSGEYANIRDFDRPTFPIPFNAFRGGSFERWAYDRRPGALGASSKYVDREISVYARDLDDHGRWRYHRDLDVHVWVPYVKTSWRPYWNGFWTRSGVTLSWVSYDPFGWVTHKYGRWGFHSDWGYYWVPARYYSPAWVAWSSYDSYIGWCPLGFRNRPYYYGFSVSIGRHYHHWNYIPAHSVVIGRRVYTERRAVPRHRRQIITRNVYVSRDDFRDAKRLTEVIRTPRLNRERRGEVATRRGYLVSHNSNQATRSTVRIQSRDSGTRAKPRFSTRVRPSDGASILRTDRKTRSGEQSTTRSRGSDGSSVLQRDNQGGVATREPLSPLPGRRGSDARSQDTKARERSSSTTTTRSRTERETRTKEESKTRTRTRETEKQEDRDQRNQRSTASRSPQSQNRSTNSSTRSTTVKRSDDSNRSRSSTVQRNDNSSRSRTTTVKRNDNSSRSRSATVKRNNGSSGSRSTTVKRNNASSGSRNTAVQRNTSSQNRSSQATRSRNDRQ